MPGVRRCLSYGKRLPINCLMSLPNGMTERQGGYTRMVKLGARLGDGAPIVQLELVK